MGTDRFLCLVQILSGPLRLPKEWRLLEIAAFHRSVSRQAIQLIDCDALSLRNGEDRLILLDYWHDSVSVISLGVVKLITVPHSHIPLIGATISEGLLLDNRLAVNHIFQRMEVSLHSFHMARGLIWWSTPLQLLSVGVLSLCVELGRLYRIAQIIYTWVDWDFFILLVRLLLALAINTVYRVNLVHNMRIFLHWHHAIFGFHELFLTI